MSLIREQVIETAAPSLMPDLSIIGVSEQDQSRYPTKSSFPKRFNADAFKVWQKLVESEDVQTFIVENSDKSRVWDYCIMQFITRCGEEGVVPFGKASEQQKTETVIEHFRLSRIKVVDFFKRVSMFDKVRVSKTYRTYVCTPGQTVVKTWAELRPVNDPTFESWLTKAPEPHFVRGTGSRYFKQLQPNLLVYVDYISPMRVKLGFEIQAGSGVMIATKRKTPTKKEVEKYMDSTVWLPIVRSHRFLGMNNRLF